MDTPQLILQDEKPAIRVGDPESPILPGDYSPSGGVYRQGQFAPSLDELSTMSLTQANQAGLINKNLPIFDDNGEVSEKQLERWNPNNEFYDLDFELSIPKYSSAVIVDAFQGKENLLKGMGLRYVLGGDRQTQDSLTVYGEIIIASEYTNNERKFQGMMRVFPSFYKYVAIPLIGYIPGRTTGLSIASYSVYHALGHLMLAKLTFDGRMDLIGDYMSKLGWSKYADDNHLSGSYMNIPNKSIWKRSANSHHPTEASRFSPSDDFAESFALILTHKEYLQAASPHRFSKMSEIMEEYGYVLQD